MIAIAIAWFLLGLLLLALGGDSIVKAVSGLAQRFGASPFTAGLLLLSYMPRASRASLRLMPLLFLLLLPLGLTLGLTEGCCCCGGNEIENSLEVNVNILVYALLH